MSLTHALTTHHLRLVSDVAGALLWAVALYYASPVQLLLLFLGRIDVERPSDDTLRLLGAATGQPVNDASYEAPLPLRCMALRCVAAGVCSG